MTGSEARGRDPEAMVLVDVAVAVAILVSVRASGMAAMIFAARYDGVVIRRRCSVSVEIIFQRSTCLASARRASASLVSPSSH